MHFLQDLVVGLRLQKVPEFLGGRWDHSSLGDAEFLRGLAFAGICIRPHSLSKLAAICTEKLFLPLLSG